MFDAIKKDNAGYAAFAAKMIAATAKGEAQVTHTESYVSPTADINAATIRPSKR